MSIRLTAVLDTNVLVSALLEPRGIPARILGHATERTFELVISDYILDELDDVLERIPGIEAGPRQEARNLLARIGRNVKPLTGSWSERDPKDNPVLGTALAAGADFLVTGDKPLLDLKSVSAVEIVNVRRFNKLIARQRGGAR